MSAAHTAGDAGDKVIALDVHIAVPLCFDLDLLADWLQHASPDTLHELGEFADHATGNPELGANELISSLGYYGVILRRLLAAQHTQRR